MSLDTLHSQNQQYHALGRNDERIAMKRVRASQVFPFISSSVLVLSALVQNGYVVGCPSQVSSRRECAPCFCYSVLLTVVLGRPELKGVLQLICTRILSQKFAWPQTRPTRQVLHEIGKRPYQYHNGPAQSLNKSNMSSLILTVQSLHHSPVSR